MSLSPRTRWSSVPVDGDADRAPDWLDQPREPAVPRPERRIHVLRRIDPWSALKCSLVFYFSVFLAFLAGGVGLWLAARSVGVIGSLEGLIEDLGLYARDSFRFRDGYILRVAAVVGPILVVLASLATVVGVALYNLAARLFGGVELTVSDETDVL